MALYDTIGKSYVNYRQPDIRIADCIIEALGDAKTVVNVGAGTGSYEPFDKEVTAVEPSEVMISQRPPDSARAIQASAECLPFLDKSFDAAMAILTIHHWSDWKRGLKEMIRVANKAVIFTWDRTYEGFWLTRDYFPEVLQIDKKIFPPLEDIVSLIGNAEIVTVPIPADCTDGFGSAYWARPEAYLDVNVRNAMSTFARLSTVDEALSRLKNELANGVWQKKYGHLLALKELDLGFRLIIG